MFTLDKLEINQKLDNKIKMIKPLLILICLIPKTWSLNAGLVNYSTLFLLHPEMKNYHFGVHNFFKAKDINTSLAKNQIDSLLSELRELYLENQQKIQAARKDLLQEQLDLEKRLLGNNASWKSKLRLANMQKELQVSYGEVHKGRQKVFFERITDEFQKVFLSSLERRRRISRISRDIQKAIENVRTKNSLDFVSRGSDKLLIPTDWERNLDIKSLSLQLEQIQSDYLRRFLNNQSQSIDLKLIQRSGHSQQDARTALLNNIHVKSLQKYLNKYQSNNPRSMVFGNVKDVTKEALRLIYDMNGFSEERFSIIATVLDQIEL